MAYTHALHRRTFLALLSSAAIVPAVAGPALAVPVKRIADSVIAIEFDTRMRSRILRSGGSALTGFDDSETLRLKGGLNAGPFSFRSQSRTAIKDRHGSGVRHRLTAVAAGLEKTVTLTLYARHPGFVLQQTAYRNLAATPLEIEGWRNGAHVLENAGRGFWSWCGASHPDRRDWVQPIKTEFRQTNFMGMNGSDYGSGTPIVDVWRPDAGLAVGHVETAPKPVSLPLIALGSGQAALSVEMDQTVTLAPGDTLTTLETFVTLHGGDFFATQDRYRRIMAERGLAAPQPPETSYDSTWCAWGYDRIFTIDEVKNSLPKVVDIGLKWAVLDDGWQNALGDWQPDPAKFPRGDEDVRTLVRTIKAAGLKPKLWVSPLALAPGSDMLHTHPDMLLTDQEGAPQLISWWNSFYQCPAYPPVIAQTKALIEKIFGDWGFEGVKLDGQHLNGVAPCHNPAHHHATPQEAPERLQDFWKMVYDTARTINPNAVIEFCPCGDCYAFFNLPYVNHVPASDPESSWQVRHKGKSLKALMGPSAAYAGDHVELSDGGNDFASSFGIGAILSTKFTWPHEGRAPKSTFLLTAEREKVWRHWIGLYNRLKLSTGTYRGELYDIGFDKPETHVVEKNGRLYYAFYAETWQGPIVLRGLKAGRYRLHDYVEDRDLGTVSATAPKLDTSFRRALLIEAVRIDA